MLRLPAFRAESPAKIFDFSPPQISAKISIFVRPPALALWVFL
jgi:hypothetical protein